METHHSWTHFIVHNASASAQINFTNTTVTHHIHYNKKTTLSFQKVFTCLPEKVIMLENYWMYNSSYGGTTDTFTPKRIMFKNAFVNLWRKLFILICIIRMSFCLSVSVLLLLLAPKEMVTHRVPIEAQFTE